MWPLYLTAFTTFTYSMAGLEFEMPRRPRMLAWFVGVVTCGALVTRFLRRLWLAAEPGLRFAEEDPDALFEGFHLSEGLAARGLWADRAISGDAGSSSVRSRPDVDAGGRIDPA